MKNSKLKCIMHFHCITAEMLIFNFTDHQKGNQA